MPADPFYSSLKWKRLSRACLMRDRICTWPGCNSPSKIADHIESRNNGGADALSNLAGLCMRHHNGKTIRADGGFGRLAKAAGILPRVELYTGRFSPVNRYAEPPDNVAAHTSAIPLPNHLTDTSEHRYFRITPYSTDVYDLSEPGLWIIYHPNIGARYLYRIPVSRRGDWDACFRLLVGMRYHHVVGSKGPREYNYRAAITSQPVVTPRQLAFLASDMLGLLPCGWVITNPQHEAPSGNSYNTLLIPHGGYRELCRRYDQLDIARGIAFNSKDASSFEYVMERPAFEPNNGSNKNWALWHRYAPDHITQFAEVENASRLDPRCTDGSE